MLPEMDPYVCLLSKESQNINIRLLTYTVVEMTDSSAHNVHRIILTTD